MKNINYEEYSDIYDKDIFTVLDYLESSSNKNRTIFDTSRQTDNSYKYKNNSKLLNKTNNRKKNFKNEREKTISLTNHSIGNNLSNIKKQLNNISINEKNTLKITRVNNYETTKNDYKLKNIANIIYKKIGWKKSKQISFSIIKSIPKNDIMAKNKELQNENESLKENIKFLLGQIKKFKKTEPANSQIEQSIFNEKKINVSNNKSTHNNNNKINIVSILNKYKKEIKSLQQKLKDLTRENNELKDFIFNSSKNEDEQSIFNDKLKVKENKKKCSIIKNPLKNNILLQKVNPLNQKRIIISQRPYRKKSFNKTFNSNKNDSSDLNTYNCDKSSISKLLQTYNSSQSKKYNDKFFLINTDNKNAFNTISANKGRKLILIDSDFNGNEKMDIQINAYTTKNKIPKDKLYENNFLYNNNSIPIQKFEHLKSRSFHNNNELSRKKKANSNKKISINNYF